MLLYEEGWYAATVRPGSQDKIEQNYKRYFEVALGGKILSTFQPRVELENDAENRVRLLLPSLFFVRQRGIPLLKWQVVEPDLRWWFSSKVFVEGKVGLKIVHIPNGQMEEFIRGVKDFLIRKCYGVDITVGSKVRIVRGALVGKTGIVSHIGSKEITMTMFDIEGGFPANVYVDKDWVLKD